MAEAQTLQSLNHPNLVPILESGRVGTVAYYAMPFVSDESLETILQRGPLSAPAALAVGIAVASALECIHGRGIIHRDIKPSNVLVPGGNYRAAKLTDFGLQGMLDPEIGETSGFEIFGTPLYMAPEQLRAEPNSAATDTYGLGALLYRMIYGTTPFSGDTDRVFRGILHGEVACPAIRASTRGSGRVAFTPRLQSSSSSPSSSARSYSSAGGRSSPRRQSGVGLVIGGVLLGMWVRHWIHRPNVALGSRADQVLGDMRTRDTLTQSIQVEVGELLKRCRTVDQRVLGMSVAIMIDEYQEAQDFDDRHRALEASVAFLEKLMTRLSPWYVRYEKLIATLVALLGIVPGLVKIAQTFMTK